MSGHTPEPWVENADGSVNGADGKPVFSPVPAPHNQRSVEVRNANRKRIVACVNACAGLPTETLEVGGLVGDAAISHDRLVKTINERLGWHRDNLEGWKEPDGYLIPTEPDLDERRRVRAHLMVAVEVLEELKRELGLED